jgi:hypothetical protein
MHAESYVASRYRSLQGDVEARAGLVFWTLNKSTQRIVLLSPWGTIKNVVRWHITLRALRRIRVALRASLLFIPEWSADLTLQDQGRVARHSSEIDVTRQRHFQFRTTVSSGWLLNLPHWLLERSSGGSQHHESSSEQKHELQAPRNQESCNREGDGGYSEGG